MSSAFYSSSRVFVVLQLTRIIFVDAIVLKLQVETLHKPVNCTEKSVHRNILTVHYTGTTLDGKVFDSSRKKNRPVTFRIGVGEAMMGWEEGLINMCVGEKRMLIVPPNLAFVAKPGYKTVAPSDSVLQYEMELLKIDKSPPSNAEVFKEIDLNSDRKISRDEMSIHVKKLLRWYQNQDSVLDYEKIRAKLDKVDENVEKIFNRKDIDKNGYISYAELYGLVPKKYDEF
ncbi:unnamed protein product [Allacma fusca]|uniref:peptidylprolyl isomerase n=1 Tax=Allacma fusca TaxID=39272 RepID=A0A8J2PRM4_9HEXA|nr:unnamed protein product [Allacma fusca]